MRALIGVAKTIVTATSLAFWLAFGASAGDAARISGEGTVVAVDADRGRLVVANDGGDSRELHVDIATLIFDDRGHPVALDDLRVGDRVAYRLEIADRLWTVTVTDIHLGARSRIATSAFGP